MPQSQLTLRSLQNQKHEILHFDTEKTRTALQFGA